MSQPDSNLDDLGDLESLESLDATETTETIGFTESSEAGESPESLSAPAPERAVVVQKQRANIYTTMLAISVVAIILGCVCLAAELNSYGWAMK